MSLEKIVQNVKRSILGAGFLLGIGLNSEAGIVKVDNKRYDVQENRVISLDDGRVVDDFDILRRAKMTDMIQEELMKWGGKDLERTQAMIRGNQSFFNTSGSVKGVAGFGARLLSAYLSGKIEGLSEDDIEKGVKSLSENPKSELELVGRVWLGEGARVFPDVKDLYHRVASGEALSEEEAWRFIEDDRYLSVFDAARGMLAGDYVEGVKLAFVKGLSEGGFSGRISDRLTKVLDDVFNGNKRLAGFRKDASSKLNDLAARTGDAQVRADLDAMYMQARVLVESGQYDMARPIVLRVLERDPKHAKAHNCLGVIYGDNGDFVNAVNELKIANNIDTSYIEPYFNLALYLSNLGRHEEALGYANIYLVMGDLLPRKTDIQSYVNNARRALSLNK